MVKLIKPHDFKDTKQLPSEPVMLELGRTAIVSASIEDIMHLLYWKFAGLADPVGAVITGDARATRLAEDIVRIAKAAKADSAIVDDLKDIFAEHLALTQERNKFLHWIWSWNTATDPPTYKTGLEGKYVSHADVSAVADGLVWVEHRLAAHLMTAEELEASKAKHGLAGAYDAPTPWLERLPLQETNPPVPRSRKK